MQFKFNFWKKAHEFSIIFLSVENVADIALNLLSGIMPFSSTLVDGFWSRLAYVSILHSSIRIVILKHLFNIKLFCANSSGFRYNCVKLMFFSVYHTLSYCLKYFVWVLRQDPCAVNRELLNFRLFNNKLNCVQIFVLNVCKVLEDLFKWSFTGLVFINLDPFFHFLQQTQKHSNCWIFWSGHGNFEAIFWL